MPASDSGAHLVEHRLEVRSFLGTKLILQRYHDTDEAFLVRPCHLHTVVAKILPDRLDLGLDARDLMLASLLGARIQPASKSPGSWAACLRTDNRCAAMRPRRVNLADIAVISLCGSDQASSPDGLCFVQRIMIF